MRAISGVALLTALLPLACDAPLAVTSPHKTPAPIIFGNTWLRSDLPFVPSGINDSGAIVGSINNTGVRSLNGTLTTLPAPPGRIILAAASFLPPPVFHPTYSAAAIANTGHIAGTDGNLLLWTSLTHTPQEFSFNGKTITVSAINDGDMVVGTASGQAFRWTPAQGFQVLAAPFGFAAPVPMVINDNGYVAGYAESASDGPEVLVRWDPSGNVSRHLPLDNQLPENRPAGIDAAGDVLSTSGDTTFIWGVNGSETVIPTLPVPTRTEGWGSLGRVVGHTIGSSNHPWTWYQGTLTFLPQPTLPDEADIPAGVNSCGTIIATRVNNDAQLDSGYVWRHSLFCDQLGQTLPIGASAHGAQR